MEDDEADEKTLKYLLYCKNYLDTHPDVNFGVTCEMRSVENQLLAQGTLVSDFVISRNIASLMMSQIAENRELREIFEKLLSSEGFEIYMKPAKYYLDLSSGESVDIYSVQDAAAAKGEIFLGYKKNPETGDTQIVLNPEKMKNGKIRPYSFSAEDEFIVLAENMTIRG